VKTSLKETYDYQLEIAETENDNMRRNAKGRVTKKVNTEQRQPSKSDYPRNRGSYPSRGKGCVLSPQGPDRLWDSIVLLSEHY
jgi:hypothetical protein